MDRMKTFFKYAMWIVLFFLFSEVITTIGLNSSYRNMKSKNGDIINSEQLTIEQAQATLVNGKIKGSVRNAGDEDLNGKYVRIDIYSERDVLLGTKYYPIKNLAKNEAQSFEIFFKVQYAKYFETSIVDEAPEGKLFNGDKIIFMDQELSRMDIFVAVLFTKLILL